MALSKKKKQNLAPTALNIAAEAVATRKASQSDYGRPSPTEIAHRAAAVRQRQEEERAGKAAGTSTVSALPGVSISGPRNYTPITQSVVAPSNPRVTNGTEDSWRNPNPRSQLGADNVGGSNYLGMAFAEVASGVAQTAQNVTNKFLNDTENRNTGLDTYLHRTVGQDAAAAERSEIEAERSAAREEAGEPTAATNRRMTHREEAQRVNAAAESAVEEAQANIVLPETDKFVDYADRFAESVSREFASEIENAPVVADVARGVGGVIPAIAANFVVPGAGGYVTFTSAAQGATDEAMAQGASEDAALLYGTAVGGMELIIGKAFDGMAGVLGKGAADDLISSAARKAFQNNKAAQGAFIYFANSLGEGFEEFATEYANALANRLTVKTDQRSFGEVTTDALYSAALGAIISDVIQGGQIAATGRLPSAEELADSTVEQMEQAEIQTETLTPNLEVRAEEENAAPESGVDVKQEARRVVDKIAENAGTLSEMPTVSSLTGNEFKKSETDLVTQVGNFFRSIGNAVFRRGFGDVVLDSHGVRTDIAHGLGRAKAITFASVPEVIANGQQIDFQENWKGRRRDSYIFAAPVEIDGKKTFVGAVVLRGTDNRFYLHEVVDENGNVIYIKRDNSGIIKNGVTAPGGITVEPELSTEMITQPGQGVNRFPSPITDAIEARAADESVGAAPGGFDPVSRWQMEAANYHPVNEEAAQATLENRGRTPFDMPTTDIYGKQTSKHAATLINANITTNEMASALAEEARKGTFSYMQETDSKAAEMARRRIEYDGWDAAYGAYKDAIQEGRISKDIVALGVELYNNAVNSNDILAAMDIVSLMVQSSRNTAQALQAMSMVNKASPEMQLYMRVRSIENIRDQLIKKYGDKAPDLNISEDLLNAYRDSLVSGDKRAQKSAWHDLMQDIANQTPATFADKMNSWRYLAMLGNVRTHVRNIEGNVVFSPVRMVKNALATGIEGGVSLVSGGKIGRTKSFLNPLNANDRALIKEAWGFFSEDEQAIQSGGKYDDSINEVEQLKTIFKKNVPLEAVRKANSWLLDQEDILFSRPAYTTALAGWFKANGISPEALRQGVVDEQTLAKAREYAVREAARATFRDVNVFSNKVSKLGRNSNSKDWVTKGLNIAVESVLPFKKTPSNILVRGVEYSPIGLVRGMVNAFRAVGNNQITAADAIDQIAAGATGSMLLWLGILAALEGAVIGGSDDDEKQQEFNELQGYQNYAIVAGDKTYTIDNLSPAAMPFFTGVEIVNSMKNGITLAELGDSLERIADPMLEMSHLSSVQDLIDSVSYVAEGDSSIGALISSMAINYLSQYLPTLDGQIERTFLESEREQTYRYGESEFLTSTGQYNLGKALNKIPGVDYQQIPYIDAWGRRDNNGTLAESFFRNFVNPSYVSEITTTRVDEELQRLYDAGMDNVFPSRALQSTKIEGEYMSAEDFVTYAETKGQTSYDLVKSFMDSSVYGGMDDEDRAEVIDLIYQFATDSAKREVVGSGYSSDWDKYVGREDELPALLAGRVAMSGETTTSGKCEAITDADYMSDAEKIATMEATYTTASRAVYYQAAYDNDIPLDDITMVYNKLDRINDGNVSQWAIIRAFEQAGLDEADARTMYAVFADERKWEASFEEALAAERNHE